METVFIVNTMTSIFQPFHLIELWLHGDVLGVVNLWQRNARVIGFIRGPAVKTIVSDSMARSLKNFASILATRNIASLSLALMLSLGNANVSFAEDSRGGSTSKAAQDFFNEGLQKSNSGDFQGSAAAYSQALAVDSKYGKAYANRGCARYNMHDYSAAIQDFDTALTYFPDNAYLKELKEKSQGAIAQNNNAAAVNEQQRLAAARQMLLQAQLGGDFADPSTMIMMAAQRNALMNRMSVASPPPTIVNPHSASQSTRSGNDNPFTVSSNAPRQPVSSESDSPFTVNSGPPIQSSAGGGDNPFGGTSSGTTGGTASGTASIASAVSVVPKTASIESADPGLTAKDFFNRGCTKSAAQDFANAIPEFSRSIELDPKFGDCYANRGLARFHVGDFRGALKDFQSADKLIPNNPELKHYIELCHQMGAK